MTQNLLSCTPENICSRCLTSSIRLTAGQKHPPHPIHGPSVSLQNYLPPPCPPTHGPPVSPPVYLSSLANNYMIWTLVQKTVASLDQRFENAQDKLLESLIGTKKVRFPGFPWTWCEMKPVVLHCCKGQVIHRCPCFGFVAVLHPTLADVY